MNSRVEYEDWVYWGSLEKFGQNWLLFLKNEGPRCKLGQMAEVWREGIALSFES